MPCAARPWGWLILPRAPVFARGAVCGGTAGHGANPCGEAIGPSGCDVDLSRTFQQSGSVRCGHHPAFRDGHGGVGSHGAGGRCSVLKWFRLILPRAPVFARGAVCGGTAGHGANPCGGAIGPSGCDVDLSRTFQQSGSVRCGHHRAFRDGHGGAGSHGAGGRATGCYAF